jgi:tRNA-specific 2-thiouridylase
MPTISKTPKKIIVGMSGGVDSSVAALLLQQQGYAVEGLFMKNWDEDDGTEYCTAQRDLADAQAVCARLRIHLHQANFAAEYWDRVFSYFVDEYRAGRTPNPDILCNKEIKFHAFFDYAQQLGADWIATGHYARRSADPLCAQLLKGVDSNKDQSYFLYAVNGQRLAKTLFPLGELQKTTVRQLAREHDLTTHDKKDSTGICFIGERRFRDFLQRYVPAQPGNIEDTTGQIIGQHQGTAYYTIGQRQGLGIGGVASAAEQPWYVVDKDSARNVLIVAQGHNHPRLLSQTLTVVNIHWVTGEPPVWPLRCAAKIRYRQADQDCTVHRTNGQLHVVFDQPQCAATPGQSVVFYQQEVCLGGGVIEKIESTS